MSRHRIRCAIGKSRIQLLMGYPHEFDDICRIDAVITYLSNALHCAIMGMLVVYCLKDVTFFSSNHGIPEAICVILVVILHKWKHNSLLSIFVGTVVYMLLVQMVF